MKTDPITLNVIKNLFQQYEQKVLKAEHNKLSKVNTDRTYLIHSENFIKWAKTNLNLA